MYVVETSTITMKGTKLPRYLNPKQSTRLYPVDGMKKLYFMN